MAALPVPEGELYAWDPDSTYVREAAFFAPRRRPLGHRRRARPRAPRRLGHDRSHLAGRAFAPGHAGRAVARVEHGVEPRDFNSYGARRGNHEVMVRGTFANIRLRNALPSARAASPATCRRARRRRSTTPPQRYRAEGVPLVVIAGREYGSGSSRDWAAKGSALLGVRAVIAESYERIHRSNLVALGRDPAPVRRGRVGREPRARRHRDVHHPRPGRASTSARRSRSR